MTTILTIFLGSGHSLHSPLTIFFGQRSLTALLRIENSEDLKSGHAWCHGAAVELQHEYVQKPGCLKVILERNSARVPNWSRMPHSEVGLRGMGDEAHGNGF